MLTIEYQTFPYYATKSVGSFFGDKKAGAGEVLYPIFLNSIQNLEERCKNVEYNFEERCKILNNNLEEKYFLCYNKLIYGR